LRWRTIALSVWALILLLAPPAVASPSSHGGNCVAYAREVTGIQLDGDAAAWWPHAAGRYERGQQPKIGAILVFKPSGNMRVGHVAVVSRIVGQREILVDQANWIPGRVVTAMSVIDASPANDWTSVKVIELHSGTHGRENPTYGFIYPNGAPANFGPAIAQANAPPPHERPHVTRAHETAQPAPHGNASMQADFHLPSNEAKLSLSSNDTQFSRAVRKPDHRQVAVLY
jgi:surface antigen